jgi:cytochrome c-type biogenesis protein CcmE
VIVTQFLRSAVDYYCNVDEIGVRDGCDAGRRLRVQGVVEEESVAHEAGFTTFVISFGGRSLPVRYRGEPGGMFAECEPVVVHGRIGDDQVLQGDSIEVKHSNEYVEENPDRVDSGASCPAGDAMGDEGPSA